MSATSEPVVIYTDGGCIRNPGPGGWAAILLYKGHERLLSGRFRNTTNNRMELRAAIEGLEALTRPCLVEIVTDSQYLRKGITEWILTWRRNGWRTGAKQPVKNRDLWQRLDAAVARHAAVGRVRWQWTLGHAGNDYNERADELANSNARSVTEDDPEDVPIQNAPAGSGSLFG